MHVFRLLGPTTVASLLLLALLFATPVHAHRTVRFLIAVPGAAADAELPFAPLQRWLEAALGHLVEPVSASDWESRMHVWRTERPELVLADPVAFLTCRDSVTPRALVAIESRNNYAVMVARPDSGHRSLASLRGARIALGERGSAVGHLQPLAMLRRAGLSPGDVRTLHLEPRIAWKALERGMVAAAAMEYAEIRAGTNDMNGGPTIIASGEALPPDLLFLDQRAGPEMEQRLKEALRHDRVGLEEALAAAAARYSRAHIALLEDEDRHVTEEQYAWSLFQ